MGFKRSSREILHNFEEFLEKLDKFRKKFGKKLKIKKNFKKFFKEV
jgi:hypothetical protein